MAQIPVRGHGDRSGGRAGGLAVATLIVLAWMRFPTEDNPAMQYILSPRLSWPIASSAWASSSVVGLLAGIPPGAARRGGGTGGITAVRIRKGGV